MRVCIVRATSRVFEAQPLAREGTLVANALSAGFAAEEVEERLVTDAEYFALLVNQPVNDDDRAQALREVRALRLQIFARLDGLQASALYTGDTARASAIESAKVSLRELTSLDVTGVSPIAMLRKAYLDRYKLIAATAELASPGLKAAFESL